MARLKFREGAASTASKTFSFLFATGDHGDPFPFTGAGGVIAHAFFPAPPNPEPVAGDVHFNDDMVFRVDADIDLYSVALHELGHALGLPHTDAPGTVMYPYYRRATTLSETDIANIRRLYLAATGSTPVTPVTPPAAALALNVNPPPARLASASVILAGTVANAQGATRVEWTTDRGGAGQTAVASDRSWRASDVPLQNGANEIRLTAIDSTQARAERRVSVTRQAAGGNPTVVITEPAASLSTRERSLRVRGTAAHASGIRRVAWSNSAGGSGDAALSGGDWTVPALPLGAGVNNITVTATSNEGALGNAAFAVNLAAAADKTAPQLIIQTPAGPSVTTSQAQVTVTGTAADASGIVEVTWSNAAGGSGAATGTTPAYSVWRATVPLSVGFNSITMRARDGAGNVAWRSLNVTRR